MTNKTSYSYWHKQAEEWRETCKEMQRQDRLFRDEFQENWLKVVGATSRELDTALENFEGWARQWNLIPTE